jgi:hypothetical protein
MLNHDGLAEARELWQSREGVWCAMCCTVYPACAVHALCMQLRKWHVEPMQPLSASRLTVQSRLHTKGIVEQNAATSD